jgi:hypothetical protein
VAFKTYTIKLNRTYQLTVLLWGLAEFVKNEILKFCLTIVWYKKH